MEFSKSKTEKSRRTREKLHVHNFVLYCFIRLAEMQTFQSNVSSKSMKHDFVILEIEIT